MSIRHDDVRDEAGALAGQALTTGKITYKPSISYGRNLTAGQPNVPQGTGNQSGVETRGDVLVHSLWERGSGCVLDIRITDTDTNSYKDIFLAKVLERAAKAKKAKYLQACPDRRRSFTPLVYSVDGMACKEAKAFEKRIASHCTAGPISPPGDMRFTSQRLLSPYKPSHRPSRPAA